MNTTSEFEQDLLKNQVTHDLEKALVQFKDEKIGLRLLSNKMKVHEKTLKRILAGENRPGYQTLYKIYRVLLSANNDTQLMEMAPEVVANALKKGNPKTISSDIIFSVDIEEELQKDRAFLEIYFLAGTGPVTKEFVSYRFGEHGMETLKKMLKLAVLDVQKDGTFILGKNQANLGPEAIKNCALHLLNRFIRPEATDTNGENFMGIYAEGLNEKAYNEWLKIDEEAYQKKIELTRNKENHGHIRAITFVSTDKMNPGIN